MQGRSGASQGQSRRRQGKLERPGCPATRNWLPIPIRRRPTPVNVLRVGDTVICTNQFELYTDFGVQMKARSKAVQTFVVQLANGAAAPEPRPMRRKTTRTTGSTPPGEPTFLPSGP